MRTGKRSDEMTKTEVEWNAQQLERVVDRLPLPIKIRLVERLERATWAKRLDTVVQVIRSRAKRHPVSDQEITRICEDVRQARYEREQARRRR